MGARAGNLNGVKIAQPAVLMAAIFTPHVALPTSADSLSVDGFHADSYPNGEFYRVVLRDPQGRTIASLSDPELYFTAERTQAAPHSILLTSFDDGGHASEAFYILQLKPRPRCVLAFDMGFETHYGKDEFRVTGGRRPEICSWYDGFCYRLGKCFTPIPIPFILRWNGHRFVDATAEHRALLRTTAREQLGELGPSDSSLERRMSEIGFLANKMLLAEEPNAWGTLKRLLPQTEYRRLRRSRTWIRQVMAERRTRLAHPALSSLPLKWPQSKAAEYMPGFAPVTSRS